MKNQTSEFRPFFCAFLKFAILLPVTVTIVSHHVKAQNLIPNPSFELMNACPSGWHEGFPFISNGASFAQNWFMPTAGTADYYNACAPVTPPPGFLPVSVPLNLFGYQQPRTGSAYAGGLIESGGNEYVETPLLSPTIANHRYFISYWLNLAENSAGACDLFGAYASADSLEMQSTLFLDMFTPQVESPSGTIFVDSLGWEQVAGTYVSAGDERWLTIGCFHSSADQDTIQFRENMGFGFAPMYYFFDDVCMLDLDGAPSDFTVADSTLCGNPSLSLSGRSGMNNFFWSDGSNGTSIDINLPGTYWVKSIDVNACIFFTDTIHVAGIGSGASLGIGRDTSICNNEVITLKTTNPNFDRFQWSTGATSPSIEVTQPGTYSVTAFSECGNASDTINVNLSNDCLCLFVPNAFSPNSDGLNDKFKISNLCPLGYFLFNVYNRFGERIFTTNNPNESWDGLYKGFNCDAGTYFYNVQYTGRDNVSASIQVLKGDITLLR